MFADMKNLLVFFTLISLFGCSSSRPRDDHEKDDPDYYNLIQVYDQGRTRTFYEGDISYILGDYKGGTMVMKNGSQIRYGSMDWMTIERVNKKHYDRTHKKETPFTDSVNQQGPR